jgi:hypothetical protein
VTSERDDADRPSFPDPASQPTEPQRPKRTPEGTLGIALLAYAGLNGLSGLLILLFPRFFWDVIGGAADLYGRAYDSTRFAGGALIALAVAALLVLRKPKGQNTLVTIMAVEATLVALGVVANIAFDDTPTDLWFELLMAAGSLGLAGYLWWARIVARRVLKAE